MVGCFKDLNVIQIIEKFEVDIYNKSSLKSEGGLKIIVEKLLKIR